MSEYIIVDFNVPVKKELFAGDTLQVWDSNHLSMLQIVPETHSIDGAWKAEGYRSFGPDRGSRIRTMVFTRHSGEDVLIGKLEETYKFTAEAAEQKESVPFGSRIMAEHSRGGVNF